MTSYPGDGSGWRQLAWSGLLFSAPATWAPVAVGRRHLLLADEAGPVFEVKWWPGRRRLQPEKERQRLLAAWRRARRQAEPWPWPPAWRGQDRWQTAGFAWQDGTRAGWGGVILCHKTRTALLVQFLTPAGQPAPSTLAARLLASLSVGDRDRSLWSLYDIRAELPAGWILRQSRFDAGVFRLRLAAGRRHLFLWRWGLAAERLAAAGGLAAFAGQELGIPAAAWQGSDGVLAWQRPPRPWWQRLLDRRPVPAQARLWQLPAADRILAARLDGPDLPPAEFLSLCQGYGLV
ncbi:MAG: hypothetical protein AB1634_05145 [Thermodesulfobacteriota bacterium]